MPGLTSRHASHRPDRHGPDRHRSDRRRPARRCARRPPRPDPTPADRCAADHSPPLRRHRRQPRLYEAEGLLAAPQRSASGYRHFPADTIDRIRAIRLRKKLGFTLRQISRLLTDVDDGPFDAPKIEVLAPVPAQPLAPAQRVQVDARIARLMRVRQNLATVAQAMPNR